jgi:hypothetical protein
MKRPNETQKPNKPRAKSCPGTSPPPLELTPDVFARINPKPRPENAGRAASSLTRRSIVAWWALASSV